MISISKTLQLKAITHNDYIKLNQLMQRIYPPAYKHFWKNENCSWYLDKCYGITNFNSELEDTNACYYFIIYNGLTVGIIRIVYNKSIKQFPNQLTTYLHRIYLGEDAQGKGIAKQLFIWVEKQVLKKNNTVIWLEAMDTKQQALKFYQKEGFKKLEYYKLDFKRIHKHLRGMHLMYKSLN